SGKANVLVTPILNDGSSAFTVHSGDVTVAVDLKGKKATPNDARNHPITKVAISSLKALAANFIDIEAMRHPNLLAPETGSPSSDGGGLITRLHQAASDTTKRNRWNRAKQRLEGWIQRLTGEPSAQLVVQAEEISVEFPRETVPLSCSLDALGTGVVEALVILEFLVLSGS